MRVYEFELFLVIFFLVSLINPVYEVSLLLQFELSST